MLPDNFLNTLLCICNELDVLYNHFNTKILKSNKYSLNFQAIFAIQSNHLILFNL